jgi:hypothetical protein
VLIKILQRQTGTWPWFHLSRGECTGHKTRPARTCYEANFCAWKYNHDTSWETLNSWTFIPILQLYFYVPAKKHTARSKREAQITLQHSGNFLPMSRSPNTNHKFIIGVFIVVSGGTR